MLLDDFHCAPINVETGLRRVITIVGRRRRGALVRCRRLGHASSPLLFVPLTFNFVPMLTSFSIGAPAPTTLWRLHHAMREFKMCASAGASG